MNELGTVQLVDLGNCRDGKDLIKLEGLRVPLDAGKENAREEARFVLQRKEEHLLPMPRPLCMLSKD